MLRILLAAIGLSTVLAADTTWAAAPSPYAFAVPPQSSVPPPPAQSTSPSLKLERFSIALSPGRPWAGIQTNGLFGRFYFSGELTWQSGPFVSSASGPARIFEEEASQAGFKVSPTVTLFDADSADPDLQVGVLIEDMKGRFCGTCHLLYGRDVAFGAVMMTAQWQLYSSIERRVIATIRTTGGYETKKAIDDAVPTIVFEAFRENVRQLLSSPDFRNALASQPSSGSGAVARNERSQITFAPAARARQTIADAARAVATVYSNRGHGSGFLVSRDGHLLTNYHVVGSTRYVKVRWADGSEELGEVLRADRARDVALVKVAHGARSPLVLRSGVVQTGETVFAIGTPLDGKFENTVTRGVVSATRVEDGLPFIQSDVTVNSGNSGGPLLDEAGQVLGITVMGFEINGVPAGINLFIPIGDALAKLALVPAA
jgi:serine protease Do